jgi:DNA-binding NarL/FixJ family response regulator
VTAPARISVLIADDHPLVRLGLETVLQREPGMEVVAIAADGAEAVRQAHRTRPDVILLDIQMPVKDGLTALREIKQTVPGARCIMLTGFDDPEHVLQAIEAGADGFLAKQGDLDDLLQAIRMVHAGQGALAPAAARQLITAYQVRTGAVPAAAALTPAELQVLRLLTNGSSNQKIASDLGVSVRTVATHVQHILDKLGLQNRVEAALYAREHGFTV